MLVSETRISIHWLTSGESLPPREPFLGELSCVSALLVTLTELLSRTDAGVLLVVLFAAFSGTDAGILLVAAPTVLSGVRVEALLDTLGDLFSAVQ